MTGRLLAGAAPGVARFLAVAIPGAGLVGSYLAAAICFILALKALSSPRRARSGNLLGAIGMLVAIGITFANQRVGHDWIIAAGMVVGTAIGVPAARLVRMTAMPQMVAAFNGVGGGAAALVSVVEFLHDVPAGITADKVVEILFGLVVGCLSFSGSAFAFAKLQEVLTGRQITYPGQQYANGTAALSILGLGAYTVVSPHLVPLAVMAGLALLLGASLVLPVGGADTPVLISLLNSFTGLAVAADGFVLSNLVLIVAGTLVGASGALLTKMMSDAMGRSLLNIVFGAFRRAAPSSMGTAGAGGDARSVRSADAGDVATLLAYSRKVLIVPGYGLAVAQAQHTLAELAKALEARGVEVAYAIHPVAGRMPGHMNVLLAEADVPYESLKEMEAVNPEFATTDVALVVGANDVVNPAARDLPGSPIYGMPILDVDRAASVIFLKRSMRPGFAGIDNELLYDPRTTMLFGDAKDSLAKLVAGVKAA